MVAEGDVDVLTGIGVEADGPLGVVVGCKGGGEDGGGGEVGDVAAGGGDIDGVVFGVIAAVHRAVVPGEGIVGSGGEVQAGGHQPVVGAEGSDVVDIRCRGVAVAAIMGDHAVECLAGMLPPVAVVVAVHMVPAVHAFRRLEAHGEGEGGVAAGVDGDGEGVAQEGAAQVGGEYDVICSGSVPLCGRRAACGSGGGGSGERPAVGGSGGTHCRIGHGEASTHSGGSLDGDRRGGGVGEDNLYQP